MASGELIRESVKSKPGTKAIQFIACFLLATIFWTFNTLSSVHQNTIDVRMHYILAEDKINTLKLPEFAELNVEARGWALLREIFLRRSLELNLADYSNNNDLITNSNISLFESGLPESYNIVHINPDTLHLQFDEKITRKVPVKFSLQLPLPGAQIFDSLYLQPDSIEITGARSTVERVRYWPTERIMVDRPDTLLSGVAIMTDPAKENIQLSAIAVSYKAAISFLSQNSFTTKVNFNGATHQIIKVTYSVSLKETRAFSPHDFSFSVDEDSVRHVKKIICTHFPDSVQNINIEPAFITQ